MDQRDHIKELMLKFSRNRCSQAEIGELVQYFRENPEEQVLPEVHEVLQQADRESYISPKAGDDLYTEIGKRIQNDKLRQLGSRRKKQKFWYAAVAAIFVAFLGASLYFGVMKNKLHHAEAPIATENAIILEREDGKLEVISENGLLQLSDKDGQVIGGQRGNQLVYQKSKRTSGEILFNTLKIPYGKRFEIQLSDGSQVFMNAGSSLKYPVNFPSTGKREVFLTGEAFFKVAKDEKRPFVVEAGNLEIGVLGTEFNVAAYPEDQRTDVVLVEGSVKLEAKENKDENAILKPGQLASLEQHGRAIAISKVDTNLYTAWMQGGLVFRNMSFENILKKMERHYDVTIINNDVELAKENFNASFGDEPIGKILEYFEKTYGLSFAVRNNKTIIINPKQKK
jgi:hypothetical protein